MLEPGRNNNNNSQKRNWRKRKEGGEGKGWGVSPAFSCVEYVVKVLSHWGQSEIVCNSKSYYILVSFLYHCSKWNTGFCFANI